MTSCGAPGCRRGECPDRRSRGVLPRPFRPPAAAAWRRHPAGEETETASLAGSDHHLTHRTVTTRREVVVVGGGQAGLAIGYFLARQGRDFTILEAADEPAAAWRERWDSLKLFTPARYSSLPGLNVPRRSRQLPGARRRGGLPDRLRPSLRPAGRARQPRPLDPQGATAATWSSSTTGATRPSRSSSPPARSRCRSCRPRPAARRRRWPSYTAAPTGRRGHPRRAGARRRRWQHRASRSPQSSPARTRSICRSARVRRRCPSASSAATCSGTSRRPA